MAKSKLIFNRFHKKNKRVPTSIINKLKDTLNESADEFSKSNAFVKKIHAKGTPNPIGSGVIFALKSGKVSGLIKVLLHAMSDGSVVIDELIVLENNIKKGFGSHILKLITTEADKDDITLSLFAKPIDVHGQKPITINKLKKFYKQHGFKAKRGDMIEREPK